MKRNTLWLALCALMIVSLLLASCQAAATTEAPMAEPTQMPEPTKEPEPTAEPTEVPEPTAEPTQEPVVEEPCPDGVVTVKVHDWSSADRQEYWDQVIQAFNDANPCIVAETVKLQEDRAVRLSEIAAGTAPDLVGFDSSDLPRVYMMGGLMDLSALMEADSFVPGDVFYESVYKTGFVDGKPIAIAKDYSVSAFYANVDLFDKAGIPLPEEGWTYDDYLVIAQQLTVDKNGNNATSPDFDPANVVQWGASAPYWGGDTGWWRGFQSFLYSWGAHTISDDGKTTTGLLNSEKAVAAWEWYRDFIHTYHVAPSASYLTATNIGNDKLFTQGQLAIAGSYWGPWFQDTFNQEPNLKWSAIPLPTGPGGHEAAIMWMGWGINANSKNPNQAWQLLKWLTTEPGQRVFAAKALTGDKAVAVELQKEEDPYWKVFLAEVPFQGRLDDMTTPFYTTCVDIPASTLMGKLFQDAGATMDIQAELDKLAADADKCLAESTIE
jgi:multiple sugar transport system substrate-binding protein